MEDERDQHPHPQRVVGEQVANEELRLLEAMSAMNQVLGTLTRQTVELSQELATAERQMNALYLPFQAAIYEMQSSSSETPKSPLPTASVAHHTPDGDDSIDTER